MENPVVPKSHYHDCKVNHGFEFWLTDLYFIEYIFEILLCKKYWLHLRKIENVHCNRLFVLNKQKNTKTCQGNGQTICLGIVCISQS